MTKGKDVTNDDIMLMLSQFADNMNDRFEAIDERFEAMDERFDRLEGDMRDVKRSLVSIEDRLGSLEGRVEALEAGIKELCRMLSEHQKADASFSRLPLEKRLLKLNTVLLAAAKEAGVVLPR